jgi:hypothetical protein
VLTITHKYLFGGNRPQKGIKYLQGNLGFSPKTLQKMKKTQLTKVVGNSKTLVGLPLEFLPYHQSNSFPSSVQKPVSSSRHLYAGCHLRSNQVLLSFIQKHLRPLVLTSINVLSTLKR